MVDIISRKQWGARYQDGSGNRPLPALEAWLHHAAYMGPSPTASLAQDIAAVRQLESIGESRFSTGISYTFAVTPSGRIFQGHSVGRVGSHTYMHNTVGIAVVMLQDCRKLPPTPAQVESIAQLLAYCERQGWLRRHTFNGGHTQASHNSTECPSPNGLKAIPVINARASAIASGVSGSVGGSGGSTPIGAGGSGGVQQEDDMPYTPDELRKQVGAGVLGAEVGRTGITVAVMLDRLYSDMRASSARETALVAALEAVAKNQGADPAAIKSAVESALAGYTLNLSKTEAGQ